MHTNQAPNVSVEYNRLSSWSGPQSSSRIRKVLSVRIAIETSKSILHRKWVTIFSAASLRSRSPHCLPRLHHIRSIQGGHNHLPILLSACIQRGRRGTTPHCTRVAYRTNDWTD